VKSGVVLLGIYDQLLDGMTGSWLSSGIDPCSKASVDF